MSERLEKLLAFHAAAPGDDFTTYALALEYAAVGELEQALAWLDRTLTLAPDHAYAWYQKAALLADAGELERAREALSAGLAAAERAGDARAASELRELGAGW
jgi:tetratricopeptide (TPR) repeat protein